VETHNCNIPSQASTPSPPPTALLRMHVGASSHMCLCSNRQPANLKYTILLLLSLFRRCHVCLRHTGDSTITRSLQYIATMSGPEPCQNSPPPREHAAAATHVSLPEFYADSLKAGFFCIDALFVASRITASLTKFNYTLSKLPFSLMNTVGARARSSGSCSGGWRAAAVLCLVERCLEALSVL
jgi:hypothetical protein